VQTAAPFTMLHTPPFSQGLGSQLEFFRIGAKDQYHQHITKNNAENNFSYKTYLSFIKKRPNGNDYPNP
jgi:3-hydroxy-3-methylglutaryl CoA synthase